MFYDAWKRVERPEVIDLDHWLSGALVTLACFCCIGAFHFVVARRFKKPYFVCHVFVNAIIVFLTLKPALRALGHPEGSTIPCAPNGANSHFYLCWCFALHIYHPVFFRTGKMDWIHHIPVYALNMLMFGCKFSDVFALQAIIMTGLPGGIDYFLLVLEGEGVIERATYKSLSAHINNWFRAPLGFIAGYSCLLGLLRQSHDDASSYQLFVFLFMGLHSCWNPPFFGRQTIEANVSKSIHFYYCSRYIFSLYSLGHRCHQQVRPRRMQLRSQKRNFAGKSACTFGPLTHRKRYRARARPNEGQRRCRRPRQNNEKIIVMSLVMMMREGKISCSF